MVPDRAPSPAKSPPVLLGQARLSDALAPVDQPPAIEPLFSIDDWGRILNASRRSVERLRAAGKLPRPDL